MPDLDLIKQEEQGQALGLRLREDDEFVRPHDFLTASFAGTVPSVGFLQRGSATGRWGNSQ